MTSLSTATDRSGVMGLPSAPRPQGNILRSSSSKQMCWPVFSQTLAHEQSRLPKLTVLPVLSVPLPCTHTAS